jgi:hypothetical protein
MPSPSSVTTTVAVLRRARRDGRPAPARGEPVDELPEGCREAVRLRVVEELDYPEIAQQLSISEPAARMRVSRALARLRSLMTLEMSPEDRA